jgi:hypothetical protein
MPFGQISYYSTPFQTILRLPAPRAPAIFRATLFRMMSINRSLVSGLPPAFTTPRCPILAMRAPMARARVWRPASSNFPPGRIDRKPSQRPICANSSIMVLRTSHRWPGASRCCGSTSSARSRQATAWASQPLRKYRNPKLLCPVAYCGLTANPRVQLRDGIVEPPLAEQTHSSVIGLDGDDVGLQGLKPLRAVNGESFGSTASATSHRNAAMVCPAGNTPLRGPVALLPSRGRCCRRCRPCA